MAAGGGTAPVFEGPPAPSSPHLLITSSRPRVPRAVSLCGGILCQQPAGGMPQNDAMGALLASAASRVASAALRRPARALISPSPHLLISTIRPLMPRAVSLCGGILCQQPAGGRPQNDAMGARLASAASRVASTALRRPARALISPSPHPGLACPALSLFAAGFCASSPLGAGHRMTQWGRFSRLPPRVSHRPLFDGPPPPSSPHLLTSFFLRACVRRVRDACCHSGHGSCHSECRYQLRRQHLRLL